ncbi:hypothetical protein BH10CYA1_BH10CYA1_59910 [soil metagenome]
MSHYSKIETQIMEKDSLIKALRDMGCEEIEEHEQAQNLYGYQGDVRPEQANIIIRRKFISAESNDVGFRLTTEGTYEAIVSEYDQELLGSDWVGKVCQNYAEHVVVSKLEQQGFQVAEKKIDPVTQKVHLVLKRGA